ncbi:GLUG motif-containing protein [Methanimicrococcus stummii]|uniref:GLUG motif-containing protein n=1 Tax=Methanimicrococcus stummii TaxID=3028294 RepID=UPI00292CBC70|nr:GLUG motif-containing protein [Methanimicrococcus sp. Es2]
MAYESGIYWIEDADDLAELYRYPSSGNYKIRENANMDMTGKTFTVMPNFYGIFDGNNVEIKNLTIQARPSSLITGMFGNLTGGTVKNMKFSNVTVAGYIPAVEPSGYTYMGVGIITGISNGSVISNIEISGFNVSGDRNTSAIVGRSNNTSISEIKLLPYANGTNSEISGKNNTGEIAGSLDRTNVQDIEIQNISVTGNNGVGCIGSGGANNSSVKNIIINDVVMNGNGSVSAGIGNGQTFTLENITIRNATVTSVYENAGILGGFFPGSFYKSVITNCHVYDSEVKSNSGSAGGFIGQFVGGSASHTNVIDMGTITDCSVTNTSVSGIVVGGFIGGGTGIIRNCFVENSEKEIKSAANGFSGGFIGLLTLDSHVENCYANTNIISESYNTGGFIGFELFEPNPHVWRHVENPIIKDCYATGTIESTGNITGGFIGLTKEHTKIENCYSDIDIKNATEYAGGFAGVVSTEVVNCYATGNVTTDSDYAGGFAGKINGSGNVTNCYATGDVEAFTAGGFVGHLTGGNIENVYSTGNVTGLLAAGGFIGAAETPAGNTSVVKNVMALGGEVVSSNIADCFVSLNDGANTFQNCYVWNGIKAQDRSISNILGQDVTFVKSYNVWDAFGSGNPESIPVWDASWSGADWRINSYDIDNTFLLPILNWQTSAPDADASHLLYLTEIDIAPVALTTADNENEANFEMTVDALEVKYSQIYYPEWEWNLHLAFSADDDDFISPVASLADIDWRLNPHQTGKQSVSETLPYVWGMTDLTAAARSWSIDIPEYFYKTATYHKNDGGVDTADVLFVENGVLKGKTKDELNWENNGLVITGWNSLPDGTGSISFAPGKKIVLAGDVDLYAQWGKTPEKSTQNKNILEIIFERGESSEGVIENKPGTAFERSLPEIASSVIVLFFVLAIAVFVFVKRQEDD